MDAPQVMLVGMDKAAAKRLEKIFQSVRVSCQSLPNPEAAVERLEDTPPMLLLMRKPEDMDLLKTVDAVIKTKAPTTSFLVSLPDAKMKLAMESMQAGAYDCLAEPFDRLDVLAAAKRATGHHRRTLFVAKVEPPKKWPIRWGLVGFFLCAAVLALNKQLNGPPVDVISLGSPHLSSVQWQGRSLWVANWYDSTVTKYNVKRGLTKASRPLAIKTIYRMQDGQPILICNTSDVFMTVGSDLKLRSHYRSSELPTLQSASCPGSSPAGLAWDGQFVWTADSEEPFLYRHGQDLRVLGTIRNIVPHTIGLAWEGRSLWVLGNDPFQIARLEKHKKGYVWRGPYLLRHVFLEGVAPSGMAVKFNRLWLVSGGDPKMASLKLARLPSRWERPRETHVD